LFVNFNSFKSACLATPHLQQLSIYTLFSLAFGSNKIVKTEKKMLAGFCVYHLKEQPDGRLDTAFFKYNASCARSKVNLNRINIVIRLDTK
jgi:hypothetical protein